MNKRLSCRREIARRFLSLNILLSHSRSFETTLLSRACVSPISIPLKLCLYIVPFLRYLASKWRDLETEGRGRSRSLKMTPFDTYHFGFGPRMRSSSCCRLRSSRCSSSRRSCSRRSRDTSSSYGDETSVVDGIPTAINSDS